MIVLIIQAKGSLSNVLELLQTISEDINAENDEFCCKESARKEIQDAAPPKKILKPSHKRKRPGNSGQDRPPQLVPFRSEKGLAESYQPPGPLESENFWIRASN